MDVKLPKLGEGADSGVVVSVLVSEGDGVQAGQTVLELETEKAVAPIPSSAAGTVSQIRVKVGDKVSAGQVFMVLSDGAGAAAAKAGPSAEALKPKPVGRPAKVAPAPLVAASPAAVEVLEEIPAKSEEPIAAPPTIRRLAKELGLDLTRVRGTERGGRIGMTDVRAYVEKLQRIALAPKPATPGASAPRTPAESIDFSRWGGIARKPLSQLRRVISQRMTENWQTIPHVTQFDEADITRLMELRKKHAAAYESKGTHLTLTSFAVRAVAETLKKHPLLNSSLDEAAEEIVLKEYVHLGIAVDTEAGLIVPVLRNADKKDLLQISRELEELAAKARDRKVSLDDLKGGTFTISNQGGIGGAHFTPIINKPEVAILGLGRGALKPVIREKQSASRLMLPIALSYDHRVIDGGAAVRFVVDLVQALEQFPDAAVKL